MGPLPHSAKSLYGMIVMLEESVGQLNIFVPNGTVLDYVPFWSNGRPTNRMEEAMIIIPDYLIIDEIRRREENKWQPETMQLPLPNYEIPDSDLEYPRHEPSSEKKKKNTGRVITIDLNGGIL